MLLNQELKQCPLSMKDLSYQEKTQIDTPTISVLSLCVHVYCVKCQPNKINGINGSEL